MPNQNRPTFRLNNPIDVRNPISNLDIRYGPYYSRQEALDNLPYELIGGKEELTLRGIGRTVLIIENGEQVEYWFKDGIKDEHLVRKTNAEDGRTPELREHLGWIQWKYENEINWKNLHKIPEDGKTPHVGPNGNWHIDSVDMGVKALGIDGEKVVLRVDNETIQWKYENDSSWKNLLALSLIKGEKGTEIELSVQNILGNDWVSWRYVDETEWTPLVNVSNLKGDDGITPHIGTNGNWHIGNIDTGFPSKGLDGDELELRVFDNYIQWKYEDEDATSWRNLISLTTIEGEDGREIELSTQVSSGSTWISWRYVGTQNWTNLVSLNALTGADGHTPEVGPNGNWYINGVDTGYPSRGVDGDEVEMRVFNNYIQWKYEDEDANSWRDLISIDTITGNPGQDGREIELSTQNINGADWVVWRYVGTTQWTSLLSLDTVRGADGHTPAIGPNGNWFINGVDTGYPSRGENGDEVELWTQEGWIVWKYEDEPSTAWRQLIQIESLAGEPGESGREVEFSTQTLSGVEWIVWKYVDETAWIPLIQVSALQGEPGRTPEMRFDGVSKIQWKYTDDTQWIDLYEFSRSVLDGVDFKCMVTPGQIMTDTDKFQLIIDRVCSLQRVKRTGARNYIADSIYVESDENISCPYGYEYNSETGLCEATGVAGDNEQLDLLIIHDESGSVNSTERTQMLGLSGDIISHFQQEINDGDVRVGFLSYAHNIVGAEEATFDFSSDYKEILNRNFAPRPSNIGSNTASQISFAIAKFMYENTGRPNARKQIVLLTDGPNNNSGTIPIPVLEAMVQPVGHGLGEYYAVHKNNTDIFLPPTASNTTYLKSQATFYLAEILKNSLDVNIGIVVLGSSSERNNTKNYYLANTAATQGFTPVASDGSGIQDLNMFEAEFAEAGNLIDDILASIDIIDAVQPTITGGSVPPSTYNLVDSIYDGLEWDGLMQGNVSKYKLTNPAALESTIVSMGLEERIEIEQDYAYSQFIKVDKAVAELSVWLVGAEQHLLDSIKNPIPNKWYRLEGVRNLTETVDVEKEEARVVIKYKRNTNTSGEVVSIYRPTLVHGETIPDWMPSLKEMIGDFNASTQGFYEELLKYAQKDASNISPADVDKWKQRLGLGSGGGVFVGSSSTYINLPSTGLDGDSLSVGDWAVLAQEDGVNLPGGYVWDGIQYVYDYRLATMSDIYISTFGKFLDKLDPQDPNANKIYLADGTLIDSIVSNGVTPTITASVVTSYDIDPQTETEHWNLTMTGDTDFDFTNMFASGHSKVITITLEGDYAFTFPSWLKSLETNDDYDTIGGSLVAEIVINIKNGGATPSGYYSLEMIDYAL